MTDSACDTPLEWRPAPAALDAPALVRLTMGSGPEPLVPLTRLDGPLQAESWLAAGPVQHGMAGGFTYAAGREAAFAHRSLDDHDPATAAGSAYRQLAELQDALGFDHVLRIWHYLSDPNAGDGDDERYKRFCLGRARALEARPQLASRLPAATVVGSDVPGLQLHCLLTRRAPVPIENPRQVSAYRYPRRYGPRPPAFARAARMDWPGAVAQLFLSGTASIVGHATCHAGDAAAQTCESLVNVDAVLAAAGGAFNAGGRSTLDLVKVYLRDPADLASVVAVIRAELPEATPWVCLHAALCRDDLLVEVEALASG